ncbi:coenzyme a transferase [Ophiostoma piceae UAMH 11346]|uniref:Coenzyme a transferase n=1 Tax=Ophiostoma piceae (strain UAMH 11346) TaxID=1262450 RepID=S3BTM1_OPHP1|nr:coenzyme a transferase [Ophiostoma piceae UAMH 11346]
MAAGEQDRRSFASAIALFQQVSAGIEDRINNGADYEDDDEDDDDDDDDDEDPEYNYDDFELGVDTLMPRDREYSPGYGSESSLESRLDPDKYDVQAPPLDDIQRSVQNTRAFRDNRDEYMPFERAPAVVAQRRAERKHAGYPIYGPRSLGDMAMSVLAKNADQLSAEHVRELSDKQRALLKKAIVGNCDLSLKLWKILLPRQMFALPDPALTSTSSSTTAAVVAHTADDTATLPVNTPATAAGAGAAASTSSNASAVLKLVAARTHMFCSQVRSPTSQLGPYIESLATPSMEFVAHIRIMACGKSSFDYHELVKLASMSNLGVLEIIEINHPEMATARGVTYEPPVCRGTTRGRDPHKSSQANDKLFIGWCSAKPVPFPQLRVLRLWGCMSQSLSQRSLEYAAAFPKLAYYELSVDRIWPSDETSRKPGPGFEDGPRGAWTQVYRYAQQYGWHGCQYNQSEFCYADKTSYDPVDINKKRPRLTLNMVEPNSTPLHATNWGGRIYSFAADTGYQDKDRKQLLKDIGIMGQSDEFPITHNVASLSLGVDRFIKSHRGDYQRENYTFVFVRTNERLQAQIDENRRWKEAQAQRKAQMAADRRARTKAQRDAANAAKKAGQSEPLVPKARKRAAGPSNPGLAKKPRGSVSVQELIAMDNATSG